MRLLERWLEEFPTGHRILDLGCGPGSLPSLLSKLSVTGVDVDIQTMAGQRHFPRALAGSDSLPFAGQSFDLVICHHSLEHFPDFPGTLQEIRRVLRPQGRLFVSVPDGTSFSDRLYRLLLCGGGHVQRFTFEGIVSDIQKGTGLHLAASKELSTSFIYLNQRNFLPSPLGPLPGPLPRRMRWLGKLPAWFISGVRILLNVGTRSADRWFKSRSSRYGWALAFGPEEGVLEQEPGSLNVCMSCGTGFERDDLRRVAGLLYRCPSCSGMNYYF